MSSRIVDRPSVVLFDFDHTLAHLGHHVRWEDARGELVSLYRAGGIEDSLIEATEDVFGLYVEVGASSTLPPRRLDDVQRRASELLATFEAEAAEATELVPEAVGCVRELAAAGRGAGIVTSNAARAVETVLERAGLAGSFASIVDRDDVGALKPSPEGIMIACRAMDVAPGDCIYIGDSVADIEAARAAGMDGYGVLGGTSSADDLIRAGAVAVLDGVGELSARLGVATALRGTS